MNVLKNNAFKLKQCLCAVLIAMPVLTLAAETAVVDEATRLIKAGDYQAAYTLLEPLESENAGNPKFDYLFGIAALEVRQATRAVFALERVLAIEPQNAQARSEIAKAHLLLGETDTAKAEFNNVLEASPPDDVKVAINKFMTQIDKATGNATTFSAYLEGTIGHDSNTGSASDLSTVALPVFGGAVADLGKTSLEQSDGFATLAGGASMNMPINKQVALLGAVNVSNKMNWSESTYNLGSFDYSAGVRFKQQLHTFTVLAQDTHTYVDNDHFRRAYGLTGQWQYDIEPTNQVSAYVQQNRLHYYQGQSIRDADRTVLGLGFAHAFAGDMSPIAYVSLYGGKEDERASHVAHLGHDLYGFRVGGQLAVKPKLVLYANSSFENRNYGGEEALFLKSRDDDQYELTLGARYLPYRAWTIRPQLSYIKNNSNVSIYDFDRYLATVSLRYDFNW